MGMVVEMLDVCVPLLVFLFTYIDVVLLLKFSGMRPLASDIQRKLPELGLYVLIFPYLLLFVYVGILESIALDSSFLAGVILIVLEMFLLAVLMLESGLSFQKNLTLALRKLKAITFSLPLENTVRDYVKTTMDAKTVAADYLLSGFAAVVRPSTVISVKIGFLKLSIDPGAIVWNSFLKPFILELT